MMKKLLIVLGALFLCLIVVTGICVGLIVLRGPALDKESQVYAEASIRAICSTWSKEELLNRASPELEQALKLENVDKAFESFYRLGRLESLEVPKGEARLSVTLKKGAMILGECTAPAKFKNANAVIRIGLIKQKEWQILAFFVDSRAKR